MFSFELFPGWFNRKFHIKQTDTVVLTTYDIKNLIKKRAINSWLVFNKNALIHIFDHIKIKINEWIKEIKWQKNERIHQWFLFLFCCCFLFLKDFSKFYTNWTLMDMSFFNPLYYYHEYNMLSANNQNGCTLFEGFFLSFSEINSSCFLSLKE